MSRLWNRFWFSEGSARLLGFQRALFAMVAFLAAGGVISTPWAPTEDWLLLGTPFWEPTLFWRLVSPGQPPPSLPIEVLSKLYLISLLTSCLGLFTRVSTISAALSGYLVLSFVNSWGILYHQTYPVCLVLFILALSPCGDGFSLDALRRGSPVEDAPQYTWPSRLVWVALSFVFFSAGLSKLGASGIAWITSDNFAQILRRGFYYPFSGSPSIDWGLSIAENAMLCHLLAFLTIVLEVGYPLGLVAGLTTHRKVRFLALCIPWGMAVSVIGFNVIMGRTFYELVAAHVFWIVAPSARVGKVGPGQRIRVTLAFAVIALGSSVAMLLKVSPLPFSYYPMYSWMIGSTMTEYRVYAVEKSGEETPLWDHRETLLRPTNRWTVSMGLSKSRDNPKELEQSLERLILLCHHNGYHPKALRAYRCRWEILPGASNLYQPERELLGEVPAEPTLLGK